MGTPALTQRTVGSEGTPAEGFPGERLSVVRMAASPAAASTLCGNHGVSAKYGKTEFTKDEAQMTIKCIKSMPEAILNERRI